MTGATVPVPRVFISYSHPDAAFVKMLLGDLAEFGVSGWIDLQQLQLGDSLILKISDAIRASDYLAACLSKASVNSSWVKKELAIAATIGIRGNRVFVLPLLLPGLDDGEIPFFLADLVYADFRNPSEYDNAFLTLIRRLRPDIIGKQLELIAIHNTLLPMTATRTERLTNTAADRSMSDWVVDFLAALLEGAQKRADPTERYWAYVALGRLGTERAVPVIRNGLRDKDPWAREGAVEAWRLLGAE